MIKLGLQKRGDTDLFCHLIIMSIHSCHYNYTDKDKIILVEFVIGHEFISFQFTVPYSFDEEGHTHQSIILLAQVTRSCTQWTKQKQNQIKNKTNKLQ